MIIINIIITIIIIIIKATCFDLRFFMFIEASGFDPRGSKHVALINKSLLVLTVYFVYLLY